MSVWSSVFEKSNNCLDDEYEHSVYQYVYKIKLFNVPWSRRKSTHSESLMVNKLHLLSDSPTPNWYRLSSQNLLFRNSKNPKRSSSEIWKYKVLIFPDGDKAIDENDHPSLLIENAVP